MRFTGSPLEGFEVEPFGREAGGVEADGDHGLALARDLGDPQRAEPGPGGRRARRDQARVAAAAVLEQRHNDGSNQLGDRAPGAYSDYTGYAAVNTAFTITDPNRWQPLAVVVGGDSTLLGPLAGIPVLIKDNISVAGSPATAGSPALLGAAAEDASLIGKLRAANEEALMFASCYSA